MSTVQVSVIDFYSTHEWNVIQTPTFDCNFVGLVDRCPVTFFFCIVHDEVQRIWNSWEQ